MLNPAKVNLSSLPSVRLCDAKHLPSCAAIYFVLDSSGAVHYIGRAVSLHERIKSHHRIFDFLSLSDAHILWLRIEDEQVLVDSESAFIHHYKPRLNIHKSVEINNDLSQKRITVRLPSRLISTINETIDTKDKSIMRLTTSDIIRDALLHYFQCSTAKPHTGKDMSQATFEQLSLLERPTVSV